MKCIDQIAHPPSATAAATIHGRNRPPPSRIFVSMASSTAQTKTRGGNEFKAPNKLNCVLSNEGSHQEGGTSMIQIRNIDTRVQPIENPTQSVTLDQRPYQLVSCLLNRTARGKKSTRLKCTQDDSSAATQERLIGL